VEILWKNPLLPPFPYPLTPFLILSPYLKKGIAVEATTECGKLGKEFSKG
jgi:hypothetical protein